MLTLYAAWAILMIRGAKDTKANAALFDFGILANALHAAAMIPMTFVYPVGTPTVLRTSPRFSEIPYWERVSPLISQPRLRQQSTLL